MSDSTSQINQDPLAGPHSKAVQSLLEQASAISSQQDFDIIQRQFESLLPSESNKQRALYAYAGILSNLHLYKEALELSQSLESQIPKSSDLLSCFQADLYRKLGNHQEAANRYHSVLKRNPQNLGAGLNLAVILINHGDVPNAMAVLQHNIAMDPDHGDSHLNLANLYYLKRDYPPAKLHYRKAMSLLGESPFVLSNYAQTLRQTWDFEELDQLERKLHQITLDQLNSDVTPVESPWHFMARSDDPELLFKISKAQAKKVEASVSNEPVPPLQNQSIEFNLGFVSDDFREHPVAHLLLPVLLKFKDRKVSTTLFGYGQSDNSKIRDQLFEAAGKVVILQGNFSNMVDQIRSEKIGFLFDLKGFTLNSRLELFAMRSAPVQLSFLGYAGTTALENMDYVVADEVVLPEKNRPYFSERPLFMENGFMPLAYHQVELGKYSRADFSLPEDRKILLLSGSGYKLKKSDLIQAGKIMQDNPQLDLWMLCNDESAREMVRNLLENMNIPPSRLHFQTSPAGEAPRFLSREEHLARLSLADLVLDCKIYNGHSTTVDALVSGVPVLCLAGKSWASSTSASILKHLDLDELICTSEEEQRQRAKDWLEDDTLEKLKLKLSKVHSKLDHHLDNWVDELVSKLQEIAVLGSKKKNGNQ